MRVGATARVLGVMAALVVCAWFALGVRQGRDTDAAGAILTGATHLTPAQARHAGSLLDAAAQLNPDRGVTLLRSTLARLQGDSARAQALALAVTRAEPRNLQAWLTYAEASEHDLPHFAAAMHHLDALAPPVR